MTDSCQIQSLTKIQQLIGSGHFDWCSLETSVDSLVNWYNGDRSWIWAAWFSSTTWDTSRVNVGPYIIFTTHEIVFIILSLLANALIIFYHLTNPPHPKYSLSVKTKISIRAHVVSGVIGVVLPLFVFFTTNQMIGKVLMAIVVAWDAIFITTATIQAPNVYGVRSMTVPMYYTCIFLKFVIVACLLQSLIYEPLGEYKDQVTWLWRWWIVHQTYAWVRVW